MSGLYNTAVEVVAKAVRGLGENPRAFAARAGVDLALLEDILRTDPDAAGRVAGALDLDEAALASFHHPVPRTVLPKGLRRLDLPFEDETVNVWTISNDASLLVIDAGFRPADLLTRLPRDQRLELLITHSHRDHVGGISAVAERLAGFRAPSHLKGATVVRPGDDFRAGGREISVIDLRGHHPQAVGYVIGGFDRPVVAVGDAVFARSMGGCPGPEAYRQARQTIAQAFADLPGETLLLTGHGPATTLGRERAENPFLAAWLSGGDGGP